MTQTNLLYHGVNYSFDSYSCEGCDGCDTGSDYCRGSIFFGLKVDEIDVFEIIKSLLKPEYLPFGAKKTKRSKALILSELDTYGAERIFSSLKGYDPNQYEINTGPDYYGEEVRSIYFSSEANFSLSFQDYLKLSSNCEKIKFLLKQEYNFLPERLRKTFEVELKTLNLSLVKERNSHKPLKSSGCYRSYQGIYGIVDENLHLIDGHHRTYDSSEKKKTGQFWQVKFT